MRIEAAPRCGGMGVNIRCDRETCLPPKKLL